MAIQLLNQEDTKQESFRFEAEAKKLTPDVMAVTVKDEATLITANELLATYLAPLRKNIKARLKLRVDALKDLRSMIDADYLPALTTVEGLIDYLKGGIGKYVEEQEAKAEVEQARLDKIAREKELQRQNDLEKLMAEGKPAPIQQIPEPVAELAPRVDTTLRAAGGTSSIRKIPTVDVFDESLIPRKYLILNMVMINRDVKGGIKVPGCKLIHVTSVSTRSG